MWVKICGVKKVEDVEAVVSAGADAVGFVLEKSSPRFVSLDELPPLIEKASGIEKVAVLTAKALDELSEGDASPFFVKLKDMGVDTVQLHGFGDMELAGKALSSGLRVIRAFVYREESNVLDPESLKDWLSFRIMLDSGCGSGETFDWSLAKKFVESGYRVILSGGLTPENVAEAVKKVSPFGVDVSSGVESSPGVKDPEKIRSFVASAKKI